MQATEKWSKCNFLKLSQKEVRGQSSKSFPLNHDSNPPLGESRKLNYE